MSFITEDGLVDERTARKRLADIIGDDVSGFYTWINSVHPDCIMPNQLPDYRTCIEGEFFCI